MPEDCRYLWVVFQITTVTDFFTSLNKEIPIKIAASSKLIQIPTPPKKKKKKRVPVYLPKEIKNENHLNRAGWLIVWKSH